MFKDVLVDVFSQFFHVVLVHGQMVEAGLGHGGCGVGSRDKEVNQLINDQFVRKDFVFQEHGQQIAPLHSARVLSPLASLQEFSAVAAHGVRVVSDASFVGRESPFCCPWHQDMHRRSEHKYLPSADPDGLSQRTLFKIDAPILVSDVDGHLRVGDVVAKTDNDDQASEQVFKLLRDVLHAVSISRALTTPICSTV